MTPCRRFCPERTIELDPFTAGLVLICFLALLGLPIGLSMITGSILYLWMRGQDMGLVAERLLNSMFTGYVILAVPLFILAAELMNSGSMTDRLLRFCNAFVGRFRGGLAQVNIVQSVIFSGMSGSAFADAAGTGRIIANMMTRNGRYTRSFAAALTASSAVIGPIIPPSIPMVLYALVSNASIGFLFLAGILPGLLMALMLMTLVVVQSRRLNFPVETPVPIRELPGITLGAFPALLMPVVLLGGIYSGAMTPTEAAAVAAAYALLVSSLLYRSISLGQLYRALTSGARSSASIGMLIAGALVFNYVVTAENIPQKLSIYLTGWDLTPLQFLLLVNVVLLLIGALLEGTAILLIIVPVFIPTATALGIDPVHFGVVAVVNIMIGLITPPYGLLIFIMQSITGAPLRHLIRDLIPFIIALLVALMIITVFPDFVLWLPRQFGYQG
ncbi:MAG: TRAP transporter large permease [Pseudotabrizicola sp.]|nr:TRAP transporter large permease [Pseudotabrizicola sp.]MDP2081188.1 TRAP transporter large permease [Pseudotabrizicola sp.]MDZ7575586.1 TRAP transporter large permease [Pseudotabrizicola sp.]